MEKNKIIGNAYVVLFFTVAILLFKYNSSESIINRNAIDVFCHGYVVSKFLDSSEKRQPRVILNDGNTYSVTNYGAFNKIRIGDTIIKESGSLRYVVLSNPDSFFFYPAQSVINLE